VPWLVRPRAHGAAKAQNRSRHQLPRAVLHNTVSLGSVAIHAQGAGVGHIAEDLLLVVDEAVERVDERGAGGLSLKHGVRVRSWARLAMAARTRKKGDGRGRVMPWPLVRARRGTDVQAGSHGAWDDARCDS